MVNVLEEIRVVGKIYFCVVFCVAHQVFLPFVLLDLVYPYSLDSAHHVGIAVETFEQIGHSGRSFLDNMTRKLLQVCCRRPRSQVKLIDIKHLKFVLLDQLHTALKFLLSFYQ